MSAPAALPVRAGGWSPLGLLRARFRSWWQSRLPYTDSVTLNQRNVYILPTRPGLMLAFTLLVLLIASINYQLNLGYLLTFMLAGSGVVGMHLCHGTLRGLTMRLTPPEPAFALGTALITVTLVNERKSPRHAIGLALLDAGAQKAWSHTDVPAEGSSSVTVAFTPPRRGLHRLPALTAETRFPLGTFRVWTIWRPAAQLLAYPTPEPHPPPLPPGEPRAGSALRSQPSAGGEFDGVRAYRRGDPLKLVVWKKAAKSLASGSDQLVSRDTQHAQAYELWLDHAQAGGPGLEARLSRLCAWILQADRLGLDYGLKVPGTTITPASGTAHRLRCLEALARC